MSIKSQQIHILAPFISAEFDDWNAISLYHEYSKDYKVTLWSNKAPNNAFKGYPVQEIKPYKNSAPNNGTLLIYGSNTVIGHWYESAIFERVILYHNLLSPNALYRALNRLTLNGRIQVEIIYLSRLIKELAGLAGEIKYPRLMAQTQKCIDTQKKEAIGSRKFTIGRIGVDSLLCHHPTDISVYKSLINFDIHVDLMGATCLHPWLGSDANITLKPSIAYEQIPFALSQLDCFYYRIPRTINNTYDSSILIAMQYGLSVVCHRQSDYAELITHGKNGFIFDTPAEAIEIITALKNNANLCKEIGKNARFIKSSTDH